MITESFEDGGSLDSLATAVGFVIAFGLTLLEWIYVAQEVQVFAPWRPARTLRLWTDATRPRRLLA